MLIDTTTCEHIADAVYVRTLAADGKLSKLQTKGMDTEGILKELVAMTQSEDARVDDPTRPAWLRQTRLGTGSASTQQA